MDDRHVDRSRHIFDAWLDTWAHIRSLTPTTLDGWALVPVAAPSRQTELVCLDPGLDAFVSLSRHVAGDPRAMLTVAAHDAAPYLQLGPPGGTRIDRDDETLMATVLTPAPITPLADDFSSRWDVDKNRITYTVEAGGQVAAQGSVGVLGDTATFDGVETTPSFQRRGLGRHVMLTLSHRAMSDGAVHGVLAASDQGRQLYLALGWTTELEMLSLMGS